MKITILGPAHPYRGGLASIMEIMARTFRLRGNEVDIKTFTLQYPSLLFPGNKSVQNIYKVSEPNQNPMLTEI